MRITISASYEETEPRDVRVLTADIGNDESTGDAVQAALGLIELWGHDRSNINRRAMERVAEALD